MPGLGHPAARRIAVAIAGELCRYRIIARGDRRRAAEAPGVALKQKWAHWSEGVAAGLRHAFRHALAEERRLRK